LNNVLEKYDMIKKKRIREDGKIIEESKPREVIIKGDEKAR
jgi:hypothetical protein